MATQHNDKKNTKTKIELETAVVRQLEGMKQYINGGMEKETYTDVVKRLLAWREQTRGD